MFNSPLFRLADRYPNLDLIKLKVLAMVADYEGAAICDLAEELAMPHAEVQHLVAMLAAGRKGREKQGMGLLIVGPDPADKRRTSLRLTKKGQRIFKTIEPLTRSEP
ncbi:hypothetical protein [Endozoicomonas sp. SESOKO4]|uniref:hypothetical protein n=1 Tax=Endozoicomonas sp. SESOKO4 TaxID=2828745 RepID=UPI0021493CF3|nr:hypothetical protein [Endozoicomonas sp. SESOKO4]